MIASLTIALAFLLSIFPALPKPLSDSSTLLTRQLNIFTPGEVPPACVNICQAFPDARPDCVELECLCTSAHAAILKSCLDCVAGTGAVANFDAGIANQLSSGFVNGCNEQGYPVSADSSFLPKDPGSGGGSSSETNTETSTPPASTLSDITPATSTANGARTSSTPSASSASAAGTGSASTKESHAGVGLLYSRTSTLWSALVLGIPAAGYLARHWI